MSMEIMEAAMTSGVDSVENEKTRAKDADHDRNESAVLSDEIDNLTSSHCLDTEIGKLRSTFRSRTQ